MYVLIVSKTPNIVCLSISEEISYQIFFKIFKFFSTQKKIVNKNYEYFGFSLYE